MCHHGSADLIVTGDHHLLKLGEFEGISIVRLLIFFERSLYSGEPFRLWRTEKDGRGGKSVIHGLFWRAAMRESADAQPASK